MADYDPKRIDPDNPHTRDPLRDPRFDAARGFNWNWVIGGIAAIVVLLLALSMMSTGERTAESGPPPATTGQASPNQPASRAPMESPSRPPANQ